MTRRTLRAPELARRCDPAQLSDVHDDGAGIPAGLVGQERARAAVELAISSPHEGFHLFVMGPAGSGRRHLVRSTIDAHVAGNGIQRSDWVYVHNFERPHQPEALQLPSGMGTQLRADMRELVRDLRTLIPAVFESDEYAAQAERLNADFKERSDQALAEVAREAGRRGLAMIRTPVGFTFAPEKDGEVMPPEVFQALPEPRRAELQKAMGEVQDQLLRTLRSHVRMRKEHAEAVRNLDRSMTLLAVDHAVDETKVRYVAQPAVCRYLDAVRADVIENANDFRTREEAESGESKGESAAGELARYEVNLVLDAAAGGVSHIVEADLPSYQNLVGRVDHVARFGALLTDFRLVKGGALHRANGGFLMIDAVKLLQQPFAWPALKRALLRREIRIESLAEMFSVVSTMQLEPQPIPLRVKVVLYGERWVCELLRTADPEFDELFTVLADLGDDMPRAASNEAALARTLASHLQARQLMPAEPAALARLIDHGARRAGDATRISAQVRHLLDLLMEAEHIARTQARTQVGAGDVAAAIAARRERSARAHERLNEAVQRGVLMIDTAGARAGQVNGLAAYEFGGETFGMPARISATSRLGEGAVIDVQREVHLGGPVHAKGVMILSSYLAARYSRLQPHSIVASIVFEQTYGLIEGDSASLGELVALVSSIADVPVRQCLAITGSVNQFGDVQAIGAVNEKIEGFFAVCAARGLDGSHGVIIPQANASHLMLDEAVVRAVDEGRFSIHTVDTVDDALELLTGMPAGDPAQPAADTVNGRVARRMREFVALRRGEGRAARRRPSIVVRRVIGEETPR